MTSFDERLARLNDATAQLERGDIPLLLKALAGLTVAQPHDDSAKADTAWTLRHFVEKLKEQYQTAFNNRLAECNRIMKRLSELWSHFADHEALPPATK